MRRLEFLQVLSLGMALSNRAMQARVLALIPGTFSTEQQSFLSAVASGRSAVMTALNLGSAESVNGQTVPDMILAELEKLEVDSRGKRRLENIRDALGRLQTSEHLLGSVLPEERAAAEATMREIVYALAKTYTSDVDLIPVKGEANGD
jgi:hypothetical protein